LGLCQLLLVCVQSRLEGIDFSLQLYLQLGLLAMVTVRQASQLLRVLAGHSLQLGLMLSQQTLLVRGKRGS
jgi:lysylphosphatidylglycerol synthetase-like protein (DUF2156 family)